MQDSDLGKEYARVDEEFTLLEALIRARTTARLTQAELAQRLGTTQSAIARLEGGRVSPSLVTLRRYAEATAHDSRSVWYRPTDRNSGNPAVRLERLPVCRQHGRPIG